MASDGIDDAGGDDNQISVIGGAHMRRIKREDNDDDRVVAFLYIFYFCVLFFYLLFVLFFIFDFFDIYFLFLNEKYDQVEVHVVKDENDKPDGSLFLYQDANGEVHSIASRKH